MSVYVATGSIISLSGARCTVRPVGVGRDDAVWPDVVECRLMTLTGSGRNAALHMAPSVGDECLLLFIGDDMSEPLAIPASNVATGDVRLVHGGSHVDVAPNAVTVVSGGTVELKAPTVRISASSTIVTGSMTVGGALAVAGAMTNGGVNIGAGHRHSNGTANDGNTGGVIG